MFYYMWNEQVADSTQVNGKWLTDIKRNFNTFNISVTFSREWSQQLKKFEPM